MLRFLLPSLPPAEDACNHRPIRVPLVFKRRLDVLHVELPVALHAMKDDVVRALVRRYIKDV